MTSAGLALPLQMKGAMTHRATSSHTTVRRSLTTLAAAASLALLGTLGTGCFDVGAVESDELQYATLPPVDCSGFKEWAQNTVYPAGTKVTDTGDAFTSLSSHTAFAPNWNPKLVASLWGAVGPCKAGGGGGVEQPPAPPAPPPPAPPAPPAPPPAGGGNGAQCLANGRPGPLFDVAGVNNFGNGVGQQFIGGQCASAADCASGCCALPCGICSGPGAQFQNGKQGCGFVD